MDCYDIFRKCFPQLVFDRECFEELSEIKECRLIEYEDKGFAAVKENDIRLLCVSPEYRGQGIGSRLLRQAEEHISANGFDEAVIGGASSRLFIGVVVSRDEFDMNSCRFFEQNGYTSCGGAAEMKLELDAFSAEKVDIPVSPNVSFGEYNGSLSELHSAVAAVDPDWVRYFDGSNVFCGYLDGEIASFCITEEWERCLLTDGKRKVGSIGCVGTVPKFRRRGIGLKMVSLAADKLKEMGCGCCFIHYTHVFDWYARIGAEAFLWELFFRKKLR